MSYFRDLTQTDVTTLLQFQTPAVGVQNAIRCVNGEIAAWEYLRTDADGNHLMKLYDATNGEPALQAIVYALPGRDVFCGLFSSGAIPSGDILDADTIYYRVDYV